MSFQVDPRLMQNSADVADWPLCRVFLKNEKNYTWFFLVPRRLGVTELMQLSKEDHVQLIREISTLSAFVKNQFHPDKINVASLGNYVEQLHIHVVGRQRIDPLWPESIWQSQYQSCQMSAHDFLEMIKRCADQLDKECKQALQDS